MNSHPPPHLPPPRAGRQATAPAAGSRPGQHLITVMLLAAAALDLTRCGLALATATHAAAAGLAVAGLAAAALTLRTARGCQAGRPWAAWAALLIGAASAPQAAASGFRIPYTIPDTATAALGILLTVTVLATAGQTRQPAQPAENPSPASQPASPSPAAHRASTSPRCTGCQLPPPEGGTQARVTRCGTAGIAGLASARTGEARLAAR